VVLILGMGFSCGNTSGVGFYEQDAGCFCFMDYGGSDGTVKIERWEEGSARIDSTETG
jgi:hypothetical protein